MKVLITGASGFLGKNVILGAPDDWQIVAVYRNDSDFPDFVRRSGRSNVTPVKCDLEKPGEVRRLFTEHGRDWRSCLYLAAKVDIPWSVREPASDLQLNVLPLLSVLDGIHAEQFIYFSSGAVYDGLDGEAQENAPLSPTLPYAISKLAAEQYVRCYTTRKSAIERSLIVRFFGAYGPYEAPHKIYGRLIRAFALEGKREYTIYGDGRNLIDAMYVDDAVAAIRKMVAAIHVEGTVNLAGGRPLAIEVLVREVAEALGSGNVRVLKDGVANERNHFWGSMKKMRDLFGFVPEISLASGICRFSKILDGRHTASAGE